MFEEKRRNIVDVDDLNNWLKRSKKKNTPLDKFSSVTRILHTQIKSKMKLHKMSKFIFKIRIYPGFIKAQHGLTETNVLTENKRQNIFPIKRQIQIECFNNLLVRISKCFTNEKNNK